MLDSLTVQWYISAMETVMATALLLADQIPPHYDKFIDVTLKQLEFATAMGNLILGATAYLATKRLLELSKGSARPSIFWAILPAVFAVLSLGIIQSSYAHIQDALLRDSVATFGEWWLEWRTLQLVVLALGTISLGISFSIFSKR